MNCRCAFAGVPFPPSRFVIVVHIRRGDINNHTGELKIFLLAEIYRRFVDFLLPQKKIEFASPAFDIHIFVLCEGGGQRNGIVENGEILPARAVSHRCEEDPRCSVSIFDQDPLKSLAVMCQSDVLVTSRSGFSHLASSLCARGITVALPFWHSYHTSQNVVVADVPGPAVGIQILLNKSTGSVDSVAFGKLITCLKRRKAS